jgi:hypothetical protein
VLLALLAVVAVASRGDRPLAGERTPREPSTAFWDYVFSVTVALYLVGAVLLVWLLAVRRRGRSAGPPRITLRQVVALTAALGLGLLFASRIHELRGREGAASSRSGATAETPAETSPSRREPYEPEFRWLPLLVVGGAGAVAAAYLAARRRSRPHSRGADEALADELAALLDDALEDLRAEPDPRRAVVAAYARMERTLAAYGLPRHAFEAPLEYLDRVSLAFGDSQPSVRRLVFELTHLFERAKFSAHAVDAEMKEDAIVTLSALRDALGSTR